MPIRAAPIHTPHAAVDPSPILFLIGVILIFFGLAMLLPAAVDLHDGNDDYLVFVACSAISVFLGAVMTATGHGRRAKMNAREVILGVPLTWICMAVFGALPFMFLAQLILVSCLRNS